MNNWAHVSVIAGALFFVIGFLIKDDFIMAMSFSYVVMFGVFVIVIDESEKKIKLHNLRGVKE